LSAHAGTAPLINDFFIITHIRKLNEVGKCTGVIEYPELFKENSKVAEKINITIEDFLSKDDFCYSTEDEIKSRFDVINGDNNYFSIKWLINTIQTKQLFIKTLSFNKLNGKIVEYDEILNPLAKNFMPELVKLSENHLPADISWQQFTSKIHQGYIQFYILESEWHIIFNPHRGINNSIMDTELPSYLLKG
jgi:hypothetical protein